MIAVLAGTLGSLIGSFLNVVVYRVPAGRSIVAPPSACGSCGAQIRPIDNIPVVSWLMLRGKCRACAAPISARYPLVEAGTALFFTAVALRFPVSFESGASATAGIAALVALSYFAAISVALALIDLDTKTLPNVIVLPAYAVIGALLIVSSIAAGDLAALGRAAIGLGVLFVVYLILALASNGGMGFGDVKLAGVIGLVTAWLGWDVLAVAALSAFILGGAFGVVLLLSGRAKRRSGIPFGPWMLAGAWVGIMIGAPLAAAYLNLFAIG